MHIRQYLFIHKTIPYNEILKNVNGILFFIFFFFGRIVFQIRVSILLFSWQYVQYQEKVTLHVNNRKIVLNGVFGVGKGLLLVRDFRAGDHTHIKLLLAFSHAQADQANDHRFY